MKRTLTHLPKNGPNATQEKVAPWVREFQRSAASLEKLATALRHIRPMVSALLTLFQSTLKGALHNFHRSVFQRTRAFCCVVFLTNSRAMGCKKTPCIPSHAACHSCAQVMQSILMRAFSPALVAPYPTQLPHKKLLQAKLHEFYVANVGKGEAE